MKLAKAIEILSGAYREPNPDEKPDLFDSIKLGIEALERVIEKRKRYERRYWWRLPSETEE